MCVIEWDDGCSWTQESYIEILLKISSIVAAQLY